jgi:hypothetical protein
MYLSGMLFGFLENFILCFTTDDKITVRTNVLAAKAFFHVKHLLSGGIRLTPRGNPFHYAGGRIQANNILLLSNGVYFPIFNAIIIIPLSANKVAPSRRPLPL